MHAITFTVSTTAAPVSVATVCRKVRLYENAQAGTANWTLQIPSNADTAITIPAGAVHEIENPGGLFQPGQVAAYIAAASGTMTFVQEEI